MAKRIVLIADEDDHAQIRAKCALEKVSLQEAGMRALMRWLNEPPNVKQASLRMAKPEPAREGVINLTEVVRD